MNTVVIKSPTAIWSWDLETGKDGAHLAILSCITNPPVARARSSTACGMLQAGQMLDNAGHRLTNDFELMVLATSDIKASM